MRDVIADMVTYSVGRAIPAVLGLLMVALFVRMLGEQGYGVYSVVFSGVNLLSVVAIGWLSQAIFRFQPVGEEGASEYDEAVEKGVKGACAFAVVATAAILDVLIGRSSLPLTASSSCLLAVGLIVHATYTARLQAAFRSRAAAAMEVLRAVITVPAGILGILTIHPPYAGAVLGTGVSYVISGGCARVLVRGWRPEADKKVTSASKLLRRLFAFGWPITLWLGVSMSFPFAERSLIQHYLGQSATGQYAAVYDVIYRSCGLLLFPVVLVIHPRIMRAHVLGRDGESRRLWAGALAFQLVVSLVVTLVVTVGRRWIIGMIGLDPTTTLRSLVLPLAAAGCIWQIALISHKLLEARQHTRRMLLFLILSLLVVVVLDAALLRRFGAAAAAYALLTAGTLYVICVGIDGFRRRDVQIGVT